MQLDTLIGKKTYQKQGFLQDGRRVPLTGVQVSGNVITQIKTKGKEGYNSIQLGIDAKKRANRAILGHSQKATSQAPKTTETENKTKQETKTIIPKYFKEVRVEDTAGFDLGVEIAVAEIFAAGDMVDVTGISNGKGWAGGQSDRERAPGSIGQTTTPGRVYKGKKMAGRMGSDTVTVKNLEIIEVTNDGVLLVKGLVPGRVNNLILVKKVGENKKFVPLYKDIVDEPIVEEPVVEVDTKVLEESAAEVVVETPVLANVQAEDKVEEKAEIEPVVVSEVSKEEAVKEVKEEKEVK